MMKNMGDDDDDDYDHDMDCGQLMHVQMLNLVPIVAAMNYDVNVDDDVHGVNGAMPTCRPRWRTYHRKQLLSFAHTVTDNMD